MICAQQAEIGGKTRGKGKREMGYGIWEYGKRICSSRMPTCVLGAEIWEPGEISSIIQLFNSIREFRLYHATEQRIVGTSPILSPILFSHRLELWVRTAEQPLHHTENILTWTG